jgi:diguanylate cyclase (GGDEF)-like protein
MRKSKIPPPPTGRHFLGRLLFPVGLLIPALVTLFVALHAGMAHPLGILRAQQSTPWLWLLDTLPLVGIFYGRFLAHTPNHNNRSIPLLMTILMLLFIMPCIAMIYAWQETRDSIKSLRYTRQATQLSSLALRTHVQLKENPRSDVRPLLAQMADIRRTIKPASPSAVMSTEPAWSRFYQDALRPGRLTLATTLKMGEAGTKLAHALETDAKLGHEEAGQLLLAGIIGTLVLMALTLQLFSQLRVLESQVIEGYKQRAAMNQQLESANTQLVEYNQRLASMTSQLESTAAHDALTGLFNRRALEERFPMEWNRAVRYREPLSVVLLDIDYFKTYNDSFGHPAGDAVLETIGLILQHGVRITDFAARYGGEEFLILLPQTTETEAVRLAERLRAAIQAAPWKNRGVTASLGVAERTDKMLRPTELVAAAEAALQQAKKPRNRVSRAQDLPSEERKAA